MLRLAGDRAPHVFVRAEVADVVARDEPEADLPAALEKLGEHVERFGDFVGLQQHGVVVDRVAHRHRDLHLPEPRPMFDNGIEDFAQMRFRQRIDLRIHAGLDPGRVREPQRAQRVIEAALDAALPVVNVARSVNRHAQGADAGLDRGADAPSVRARAPDWIPQWMPASVIALAMISQSLRK